LFPISVHVRTYVHMCQCAPNLCTYVPMCTKPKCICANVHQTYVRTYVPMCTKPMYVRTYVPMCTKPMYVCANVHQTYVCMCQCAPNLCTYVPMCTKTRLTKSCKYNSVTRHLRTERNRHIQSQNRKTGLYLEKYS
jgi:hypothetical protein